MLRLVAAERARTGHLQSTGAEIFRLRTFPLGPIGNASTSHTWRGYL